MANVVKKYSISYELAQTMVDAAVAKARELGVSENVAILDDGGNLKGFPIKVNGEIVGAIGLSGAPTVQNDIDCAKAALALVSDAVPTK
jgi:uncharacterized protein GlcG (DUF336 family)